MSILAWILLGSIAGFVASKLVNQGEGFVVDIALGIVGAIVAGFLFYPLGAATGLDLYSGFVALPGSIVVLAAYHSLFGRRRAAQARPPRGIVDPEERGHISLHSRCGNVPGKVA